MKMSVFVLILVMLKFTVFPTMGWWLVFSPWLIAATFFFCTLFAAFALYAALYYLRK